MNEFEIIGYKEFSTDKLLRKENFAIEEVIVFCGIASPEYFVAKLKNDKIKIKHIINFKDHAKYSKNEYRKIEKFKNHTLITTEKDSVKLKKELISDLKIYVALLDIKFKLISN